MKHEEALPLLTDWAEGELDARQAAAVEAHLRGCAECRGLAETHGHLAGGLRESAERESHPAAESLVALALSGKPVDVSLRGHLDHCETCAELVRTIRRTERDLATRSGQPAQMSPPVVVGPSGSPPRSSWRRAGGRAVLAAALAGAAFLGLYQLPRVTRERNAALARLADRRAAAAVGALPFVPLATRGADDALTIEIDPRAMTVVLAVEIGTPSPERGRRFALRGPSGEVVWETRIDGRRLAALAGESGVVALSLPADLLSPGFHRLEQFESESEADGASRSIASHGLRVRARGKP